MQSEGSLRRLQRNLLIEDDSHLKIDATSDDSNSSMSGNTSSSPWPVLVGLLLTALCVAIVIVLVIKFRIVQRFFGGYAEALLPEADTASQFSQPGTLTDNFPAHGMRGREANRGERDDDDDDGFIEDNYIAASHKEKTEKEEEHEEVMYEESDDELDIHFSIE